MRLNKKRIINRTRINAYGYRLIRLRKGEWVLEHRYVMEKHLNRKVEPHEVVHHKDGNKLNNNINNLMLDLLPSHISRHWQEGLYDKPTKYADCHPDRVHYAKGLCQLCYNRIKQNKYNMKKRVTKEVSE